ncbi:MAG: (2Fe-2S) ferredoxin domain-containing protein [Myxococcales bacterium]|nr:(2Fe-2S) ferredoxin domain-containing protein [Myxococcales bacterium]MCB9752856.1 (2Fe-2S) ferredoxin domain-containing protein [Myxococcales bacterium]
MKILKSVLKFARARAGRAPEDNAETEPVAASPSGASAPDADRSAARFQLCVCDGPSCGLSSGPLRERLAARVAADPDLAARVRVYDYGCFGRCGEGPNLFVRALAEGDDPDGEPPVEQLLRQRGFYPGVDAAACDRLLEEHCGRGQPVEDLVDDY